MAITGFNESSLTTSEVYNKTLNSEENNSMAKRAINLIKNAKHITNSDIEASYIMVKQITDTLTQEAIKAFDAGKIIIIYNGIPSQSMSQALPFLTFKTPRGYETYVFADKYITMSRDNVLSMQAPVLRDLLIGALIANGLKNNYSALASNQYLQKVLMEVYTKLVVRIINREFSVIAYKDIFDIIQYWINRFFLNKILGATDIPENLERLSKSHFKYIDEMKYEEIKTQYDSANPQVFSELLELLKQATPLMKTLNFATFISNWVNYYYAPSMLAIDNIEYLIFMINTMLNGNGIISISASDIVKETKNIKGLKGELLKLI